MENALLSLFDQNGLLIPAAEKESVKRIAASALKLSSAAALLPDLIKALAGQKTIAPSQSQQALLVAAIRSCIVLKAIHSCIPPVGTNTAATEILDAHPVTAEALLHDYGLDRKLTEAMKGSGLDAGEAGMALNFAIAALPFLSEGTTKENSLLSVISGNGPARTFLGINTWQGQTWFNKERFEFALAFATCFSVMRSELPNVKANNTLEQALSGLIAAMYAPLHMKAEASGWNLEVFLEAAADGNGTSAQGIGNE